MTSASRIGLGRSLNSAHEVAGDREHLVQDDERQTERVERTRAGKLYTDGLEVHSDRLGTLRDGLQAVLQLPLRRPFEFSGDVSLTTLL
jgi:hypothetical protein